MSVEKRLTVPASREVVRLVGKWITVRIAEYQGRAYVADVVSDGDRTTANLVLEGK